MSYTPPSDPQYGGQGSAGSNPGGYSQPPSAPSSDDKTWALLAHIGSLVLPIIAPVVALLVKGNESSYVKYHATESLNANITYALVILVCMLTFFLVLPIVVAVIAGFAFFVLAIMAGIKAYNGEDFKYPAILRLVK